MSSYELKERFSTREHIAGVFDANPDVWLMSIQVYEYLVECGLVTKKIGNLNYVRLVIRQLENSGYLIRKGYSYRYKYKKAAENGHN